MPEPLKDPTPLQPNYLPEKLHNREEEQELLQNLASENSTPQNVFLHGPRGTGKTHVTHLALQELDRKVYIPCTQHDTQYKALKQILKGLNQDVSDGHHTSDLQRKLVEQTKAVNTVIILDDIEFLLLNDGDDLLYFLTRMETRNHVDLVLTSSNYSGLKSQIEERTFSSLQPRRISFEPYTAEDVYQVLVQRAQKALVDQSLQRAALTYITSTTQNISVALHWLKHAAETTDSVITESHIQDVQQKAYEKYAGHLLNEFTEHHRLLYQAVRELDVEENQIRTGAIYTRYEELCKTYNENTLSKRRLSDYLKNLELLDLIEAEYHYGGTKGKTREIQLKTP